MSKQRIKRHHGYRPVILKEEALGSQGRILNLKEGISDSGGTGNGNVRGHCLYVTIRLVNKGFLEIFVFDVIYLNIWAMGCVRARAALCPEIGRKNQIL